MNWFYVPPPVPAKPSEPKAFLKVGAIARLGMHNVRILFLGEEDAHIERCDGELFFDGKQTSWTHKDNLRALGDHATYAHSCDCGALKAKTTHARWCSTEMHHG